MLHNTKTFELGNTIYFECVYRNQYSVPVDADNPGWKITTARGATEASSATEGGPYKRSTGLWYIFWTSSTAGDYVLEFSGEINGNAVKIKRPFRVVNNAAVY